MEPQNDYGVYDHLSFNEKLTKIFNEECVLNEKLFDFQADVDMLWNLFLPLISSYKQNSSDILSAYNSSNGLFKTITSNDLMSEVCKEAHNKKPITINYGFMNVGSNSYNPISARINLTVSKGAVLYLDKQGLSALPDATKLYPLIGKEFEEDSMKGSIAHELAHWIDDALHNNTVSDNLRKYNNSLNTKKPLFSPTEWKFTTSHEIEANIHAIATLKNKYKSTWNDLSFIDLINLKPSLYNIFKNLAKDLNEKSYNKFIKRFFGRMARENILGTNMKPLSFKDVTT